MVLDAKNNYSFIKRIPTWDIPASRYPEQVAGVTASPVTQMIYVATRGRLGAWDLTTEKKVWENTYDGQCCERPQISPDGSFLYVGSNLKDFWYVVNPKTGELITKVRSPLSPDAHNLNLSLDGKLAYMASGDVVDVKTHKIVGQLRDEYGRNMNSEKVQDMEFDLSGHLVRTENQFAIGDAKAYAARMGSNKQASK